MGAVFGLAINVRELTSSAIKRQIAELRDLGDLFLGDYYPLTGYSRQDDLWVAWQFDRPDQGGGLVQAFRRRRAEQQTLELRLRNLNPMLSSVDNRQVRRLFDGKLQEYPVLVEGRDTNAILREYMRTEDRSAGGYRRVAGAPRLHRRGSPRGSRGAVQEAAFSLGRSGPRPD